MRFKIHSSVLIVNADSDLASSIKCLREHFLKKAINAIARSGRRAHARDSQPILELSPGGISKCLLGAGARGALGRRDRVSNSA
jgi:hypothetical protein